MENKHLSTIISIICITMLILSVYGAVTYAHEAEILKSKIDHDTALYCSYLIKTVSMLWLVTISSLLSIVFISYK